MRNRARAKTKLAIGAIFKNEGPYILEWVAFHRVLGVERFVIADNASDDGSTEFLAALDRAGLIEHVPFPHLPDQPPQLPAYAEIMRRIGTSAEWVAFVDGDEFMLPTDGSRSVLPFFDQIASDVGVVALNWAVFGSAARVGATRELVTERFVRRAVDAFSANHHYKSVVRSKAYAGPGTNPHYFKTTNGYRTVQADGRPVVHHRPASGISRDVVWHPLRINHYVVKSKEEFDRKRARGRATSDKMRTEAFFHSHDRNEKEDAVPEWLVQATKEEMARIGDRLRGAGHDSPFLEFCDAASEDSSTEEVSTETARGFISNIVVRKRKVLIKGWATMQGGTPVPGFRVKLSDGWVSNLTVRRMARKAERQTLTAVDQMTGFQLLFPLADLSEAARSGPPPVVVADSAEVVFELASTIRWPPEEIADEAGPGDGADGGD